MSNPENQEAFNRLIANHLLTREEKSALVKELTFAADNLWLKDYYVSRIEQQLVSEPNGYMAIKNPLNTTSIHNNIGDESGLSPSQFPQTDFLDNEDPNDTLRNPRNSAFSPQ